MRRFVFVGATLVVIAGIGGAIAWGPSRPDVDQLKVHERAVSAAPVPQTQDASVVWSGEEFIVWGGGTGDKVDGQVRASGAAYAPETDSWRTLAPAPIEARERHTAVWTGEEMIVWGGTGRHHGVGDLLDGARYDPTTDSWRAMAPAPAGTDRSGGQAVVVGDHAVIGAGFGPTGDEERRVLVYDLAEDAWDVVPVADPVIHVLAVEDEVALLTARHALEDGDSNQLHVALLDPTSGERDTAGRLDLEQYPDGAGLLGHDGQLILAVSSLEDTELYAIGAGDLREPRLLESGLDVFPPVLLLGGPEPQPVMHDGSRRLLVDPTTGPMAGIDLSTGDMARGGALEGAAKCLANGSHAVAGNRFFVWGAVDCTAGPGGPEGSALVEVNWSSDTP